METESVRIESVYEENTCTTCGRFGVDQYTSIIDNYIKYKNQLVSFIEIIRITLDFQPTPENCSMEICDLCKIKLQEFYNFKMRSIQARRVQENFSADNFYQKLNQLDESINDPLVLNTVQIIRDFIKNHSIKCIEIEENSERLVIYRSSVESKKEIFPENDRAVEKEIINNEEENMVSEYLDEEIVAEVWDESDDRMDFDESVENESEITLENTTETSLKPINLRRPRHTDEWKCNKRKKLRNTGQAYINTKGNVVEGRKMLPSTCNKCRNRCNDRLTETDRKMNFKKYWDLGDIVEQRKFIFNHIVSKQPIRRKSSESARSVTLEFFLDKIDETTGKISLVHVCKKMFKNTLSVSNQVIQGVVNKYAISNFVDSRGKHERKLSEAQQLAKEHVQQFPFFYVEQTMTKVQLYNMYIEECKEKNIVPVKESNYREIFDRFNSNSFLKTERILCEKCHRYYKGTDKERMAMQREHDDHIAVDKKCRDRALGRIRHRRLLERKRAEKLKSDQAKLD